MFKKESKKQLVERVIQLEATNSTLEQQLAIARQQIAQLTQDNYIVQATLVDAKKLAQTMIVEAEVTAQKVIQEAQRQSVREVQALKQEIVQLLSEKQALQKEEEEIKGKIQQVLVACQRLVDNEEESQAPLMSMESLPEESRMTAHKNVIVLPKATDKGRTKIPVFSID